MFRVTRALVVAPTLFATVRSTTWLAPSLPTTTGAGQLVAWVQAKLTLTSLLFQPFALAAGATLATIVAAGGGSNTPARRRCA